MITIFENELIKFIHSYEVILIPMGINNSFNSGFPYDVYLNFREIKEKESELTGYGDKKKYGHIARVNIDGITFVFCYMNKGGYRGGDSVDYEALSSCLSLVKKYFPSKKIGTPLLGYGKPDGNGDKERLLSIFNEKFGEDGTNVDLFIYKPVDRKLEFFREIAGARAKFRKKEITQDEYSAIRSDIEWRRRNGIYKKMPHDFVYRPKSESRNETITVKKKDLVN